MSELLVGYLQLICFKNIVKIDKLMACVTSIQHITLLSSEQTAWHLWPSITGYVCVRLPQFGTK